MRWTSKGAPSRARHRSSSRLLVDGAHHPVAAALLVGAGGVVLQLQGDRRPAVAGPGDAHRHQVDALADAEGVGLHVPGLHVEGDPEVLADHHPVGDDLDVAAPVGQQLGRRGGLVEAELVDDHDPALGADPALEHVADVDHPLVVPGPPRAGRVVRRWPR